MSDPFSLSLHPSSSEQADRRRREQIWDQIRMCGRTGIKDRRRERNIRAKCHLLFVRFAQFVSSNIPSSGERRSVLRAMPQADCSMVEENGDKPVACWRVSVFCLCFVLFRFSFPLC